MAVALSELSTATKVSNDSCQVYPVGAISPFGGPTKRLTARFKDTYKVQQWCLVSDPSLKSVFLLVTYPDLQYAVAVDEVPGEGGQRKTKLIKMTERISEGKPIARPILRGTTFNLRRIVDDETGSYWIESAYCDGIDSAWVLAYNCGVVTTQSSQPPNSDNIWEIEDFPDGAKKFVDETSWPAF